MKGEWLSSGNADSEAEETLLQELTLWGLRHFCSVTKNSKYIRGGMKMMEMERDFFLLEIEKVEVWEWDAAG